MPPGFRAMCRPVDLTCRVHGAIRVDCRYFLPSVWDGHTTFHSDGQRNPRSVVDCRSAFLCAPNAFQPHVFDMPVFQHRAEGAARETHEEANASVDIMAPYAHLDIPAIGQAYIFFRAHLAAPFTFTSGPESEEVALFSPEDIPFDSIAFSSVYVTLKRWVDDRKRGTYSLHHGVIRKKPGAAIRDQNAFKLMDTYQVDLHTSVTRT